MGSFVQPCPELSEVNGASHLTDIFSETLHPFHLDEDHSTITIHEPCDQ